MKNSLLIVLLVLSGCVNTITNTGEGYIQTVPNVTADVTLNDKEQPNAQRQEDGI